MSNVSNCTAIESSCVVVAPEFHCIAAGAFADGGSVARGRERGVDALAALAINDSHAFFAAEGGLLVTGATGTNVMDLVLVESS